ncbi:hypothetical protein diail_6947 [Diaporthe ilicicola]|nr:hypothetical protein diail_6947 [Diaporthe ilicicola]
MAHLPGFDEEIKASWRDLVTQGALRAGHPFTVAQAPARQPRRPPREPKHPTSPPLICPKTLREPSAPGSFDLSFRDRLQLRYPRASIGYLRCEATYRKVRFVEEPELI